MVAFLDGTIKIARGTIKWQVPILLGVFVVLICGAPIAVCLGMSSVAAMLVQGQGKPIVAVMSVLPRICSASKAVSSYYLRFHFHYLR